ncbi:MAG: M23 family metallopeptidase [Anaerolineaceae bacterium]|nr:M23 family metallopeptidase [Anaerolineaceae bacterium]
MSKTLKTGIILLVILCLGLLAMIIIDFPGGKEESDVVAQTEATPAPDFEIVGTDGTDPALIEAVTTALDQEDTIFTEEAYLIDNVQLQDDGQVAAVWLAAIDPETGDPIGREPDLVMAEMDDKGDWKVLTSAEEKFGDVLEGFQYADKSIQGDMEAEPAGESKVTAAFGGYYLPWAQNLTKRLTWSVSHTSCYPTYYCTYAFDFADGTMFPMVAAKGGTVYHWKDTCANGDSSCTNSITIQDRSTTPWTYQIYLHIAQGSVPANLKQVGATVRQGQYIADVDDTGYSTGHHVHFMVVSQNTMYMSTSGYVWGRAEDITFKDVSINWDPVTQGGRPRLAYEADSYGGVGQTYYTSGNKPANPPTGALTAPLTKTYITTSTMNVSGWGQDDVAVTKFEIMANYDGSWVTINEQTANPFNASVNLCDTDIPDGPFKLALRVWDYEGNPSSILSVRELIKDTECGSAGTDPTVSLNKVNGKVVLAKTGTVSATVAKGSTGSNITSVAFWFHNSNWNQDVWQSLGVDTNGADGWQVPFDAGSLPEANTYTVAAVATDALGNQGVDVTFSALLDKTSPWIEYDSLQSPMTPGQITIHWTGGDQLSGLDHYVLNINRNNTGWQVLEANIGPSTTSYQIQLDDPELVIVEIIAYDSANNILSQKIAMYSLNYELDYNYIFPEFSGGN